MQNGIAKRILNNKTSTEITIIIIIIIILIIRVKLKESTKRDKYIDLTRELKYPWNMKVTVIPMMIGDLEQSPKY